MARNPLASIGAVLADETRAEILTVLLDGRAHTGTELARHIGVAASSMSEHLSKLRDAGMVTVTPQGRHRYWSLANGEVAELLEHLTTSDLTGPVPAPRAPKALEHARTCYDHLAGEVAVEIYAHLAEADFVVEYGDGVVLTEEGHTFLAGIGVDVEAAQSSKRVTTRRCLDWTQRKPHLSGAVGAALLDALFTNGWIARGVQPRSVRITKKGEAALTDILGA